MTRQGKVVLGVLVAAGALGTFAATAAAQTSGSESFDGTILARATLGDRTVLASVVRARGAFNGVGRIVEVPNQPGDPDNVERDDFVFAAGTMHVVTTVEDFESSLDPRSCIFMATISQTAVVSGGTGAFATATGSFTGGLTGQLKAARNSDGSCSEDTSVSEIDQFVAQGTLSY